jgi:Protein of unknown function (DUF993)
MATITLPDATGAFAPYRTASSSPYPTRREGPFNRRAYAAAHVVADPLRQDNPWQRPVIDWETTIAFRRHLWDLGFAIAEAMDTSQRGMGLDWPTALELIRRSLEAARDVPGADLACGAGTDQLPDAGDLTLDRVRAAYEEQIAAIEGLGGRVIIMASRALARAARGPDDYLTVYSRLIRQSQRKVILHWLGDCFDPALAGYWGMTDVPAAMETVLGLIREHADKIDGIKISLLSKGYEIEMRRRLPEGVVMYTGDDFDYAELIEGDSQGSSHALLGIFAAIAPAASAALVRLAAGEREEYRRILVPTVPLSRRIFESPTQYYKAGIVFIAWLNGFQSHFAMVGGMQSARGILHYADVFRLANQAGVLRDPELATHRMRTLLSLYGLE